MLPQTLALTALALAPGVLAARAGANVKGCVYLEQQPSEPIEFVFTPGSASDQYVNPQGYENSVMVSKTGITCADVGYVKEDSTFLESRWSLGYSGASYSGSAASVWSASWWNNKVKLKNYSPGTSVCGSKHLCNQKQILWDEGTVGPIYIIFTPGATSALINGMEQQNSMDL